MTDYSIDAIKIAKAIQKDELSILHGKEFKMRDKIKKRKRMKTKKNNTISERVERLETKVDQLGMTIDNLVKEMRNGFKQVNTRLDYNGLKQVPESNK